VLINESTNYFNEPAMKFKRKLDAKLLMLGFYIGVFRKWGRS